MVQVRIRNNFADITEVFSVDMTIRQILAEKEQAIDGCTVSLDGYALSASDMGKTLLQHGYDGTTGKDRCNLTIVAKTNNA